MAFNQNIPRLSVSVCERVCCFDTAVVLDLFMLENDG